MLINGRFLAQRETGVQRVAAELVRALDAERRSAEAAPEPVEILAPSDAALDRLDLDTIAVRRVGRHTGYRWEQTELVAAARGSLLLSLGNVAPLAHARNAVMIHDASVFDRPDAYGWRFRTAMRWMLPVLARRAARLFTVSSFSADRLSRHGVVNRQGFTVVPNGADHITRVTADPGALARAGLRPGGYALFVGSPHPNKNLRGALAAIARVTDPALRLVVVGAADAAVFADGDAPPATDRAVFLGPVDDAALAGLYAGALTLLFPSFYEGFGLPPVEAMTLGCPVIAADRAAITEVCGDAAILLDPEDAAGMAAAIDRLAADPAGRADLVARGRRRAARFTWRAAARLLVAGLAGRPASRSSG